MMPDSPLAGVGFMSADVGLCVLAPDGEILAANPTAHRLLGRAEPALLGLDSHDVLAPCAPDGTVITRDDCAILRTARTGLAAAATDDRFRRADGRSVPVWWSARPGESGPTGRPTTTLAFGDVGVLRSQRAADEAWAETARLSNLAALSEMLTLDASDGLDRIAELVTDSLADGCIIDRVGEDGQLHRVSLAVRTMPVEQTAARLRTMPGPGPLSSGSLARVITGRTDQAVVTVPSGTSSDVRTEPLHDALDEAQAELFDDLHARLAVVVPLVAADGRILGAMTWFRRNPLHRFSESDLLVSRVFGLRIGQWMDHLRLTGLQQRAAVTLQRSLLTELPAAGHLELAARYIPAGEGLEIGGDWYDAVLTADGTTTVVIGDVSGHDVAAAARMAQLRSMLRFAVLDHPLDPAASLHRLDTALPALGVPGLASVVAGAVVDAGGGAYQLVFSNAGHLPPVIVDAAGAARLASGPAELILGVDPAAERTNHRIPLPPGSTVLLYTDGLVERPAETITVGLDRLVATVTDVGRATPGELCDRIVTRLLPEGGAPDDVAMIAVRIRSATG